MHGKTSIVIWKYGSGFGEFGTTVNKCGVIGEYLCGICSPINDGKVRFKKDYILALTHFKGN